MTEHQLESVAGIGPAVAKRLAAHGIHSVRDLVGAPLAKVVAVPGLGAVTAKRAQSKARELLLEAEAPLVAPAASEAAGNGDAGVKSGKPKKAEKKGGKKSKGKKKDKKGKKAKSGKKHKASKKGKKGKKSKGGKKGKGSKKGKKGKAGKKSKKGKKK